MHHDIGIEKVINAFDSQYTTISDDRKLPLAITQPGNNNINAVDIHKYNTNDNRQKNQIIHQDANYNETNSHNCSLYQNNNHQLDVNLQDHQTYNNTGIMRDNGTYDSQHTTIRDDKKLPIAIIKKNKNPLYGHLLNQPSKINTNAVDIHNYNTNDNCQKNQIILQVTNYKEPKTHNSSSYQNNKHQLNFNHQGNQTHNNIEIARATDTYDSQYTSITNKSVSTSEMIKQKSSLSYGYLPNHSGCINIDAIANNNRQRKSHHDNTGHPKKDKKSAPVYRRIVPTAT
jgi:hypothetical protein